MPKNADGADLPPELQDWDGTDTPRYTNIPDDLLDLWMAYLSGAEFKVLLYICRRTFGFKKDADDISLDQICHGIRRRDGTVLDYGTGLALSTAQLAVKGLVEKRVILEHHNRRDDGGHAAKTYRLRLRGTSTENRERGVPISGNGGSRLSVKPSTEDRQHKTQGQETDLQEESAPVFSTGEPLRYSAYIAAVVLDHARELGAEPRGPAGVETALRHWQTSGQDEAAFVARLHAARDQVRQRQKPGADKWGLYLAALRG